MTQIKSPGAPIAMMPGMPMRRTLPVSILRAVAAVLAAALLFAGAARADTPVLARFLTEVPAGELVPGADSYGPIRDDLPVAPMLSGGETVAWAFVTSDFVGTTGYSGKPIHVIAAVGPDAVLTGARLVEHSEPIVLIGIPEAKVKALTESYAGLDLAAEAAAGGGAHELDIISGATVTIIVIDDSVVRSGLRVARALGLGGLASEAEPDGPRRTIDPAARAAGDWQRLLGDGTLRRLTLDTGQVNRAFAASPDPRAAERPLAGPEEATFIDLYATLASIPGIGAALLEPGEAANLRGWLDEGDHALLVAARGPFSFKGSGYVRGGLFDRLQLVQGDLSVRFRDRDHRRVGRIAVAGAPTLGEMDLFRIPAGSGFDPAEPFRLQLLVQRDVGAIERVYTTFEMGWQPPPAFLSEPAPPAPAAPVAEESAAKTALWQRIWRDRTVEIGVLAGLLGVLTAAFFFQGALTRSARATFWFRIGFLTATLVFLGWMTGAQLSVVNLMALASALSSGFTWEAFLLDPLTFILWFSVAAALIFWGRGAYCGWLCPFGALQELTNRLARALKVPQWHLPWGLHERLWAVKYILFLGLFGVSLVSMDQAERLAEVEPFKTAIVLRFDRAWPFVLYALALLAAGLFVERFYCRYLCPLGAALAIPARIRMFDWLKRYRECGNPCQTCARDCMVQAIHPTGEINPNECLNCLNCQVLYRSALKCPVVQRREKRRATASAGAGALDRVLTNHPNRKETADV